jgi:hypothetical protein
VRSLLFGSIAADLTADVGQATGLKNILMSYEKYQTMIVRQHHVRIQGWPTEIPFNIPKIASSSDLRHIRQGLEQGSIRWVKLTREEIQQLNTTYMDDRPETRKYKRARSVKRPQRSGTGHAAKSAAYIESSDGSDSNN